MSTGFGGVGPRSRYFLLLGRTGGVDGDCIDGAEKKVRRIGRDDGRDGESCDEVGSGCCEVYSRRGRSADEGVGRKWATSVTARDVGRSSEWSVAKVARRRVVEGRSRRLVVRGLVVD